MFFIVICNVIMLNRYLKGVFAKNKRGDRFMAKNNRFLSLLILLLSVASKRSKMLKTILTSQNVASIQIMKYELYTNALKNNR